MTARDHLKYAEYITDFLDTKFSVLGLRVGIDPFLDFLPIIGPFIGGVMSLYILWIGIRLKVPTLVLVHMLINISIDYVLGLIPFVGIIGDLFYKANVRNLRLLKNNIDRDILEGEVI